MRFTDRGLKALKPSSKRRDIYSDDRSGLSVRVAPTGSKTFFFRYQSHGRRNRVAIGPYPDTSLKSAREKVADLRKLLNKGIDPGTVSQERKADEAAAPTVAELVNLYIERHAKRHKKSWKEDQRKLDKEVVPRWGKRRAKDIQKRDIVALLDDIVDRGAPIEANRVLEVVRKMFNFAIDRDLLEHNPCYRVKKPGKEKKRDRVLTTEEIRKFWRGLSRVNLSPLMRLALKFTLVTGQRRGEVLAAKWSDFDGETWRIPETKNTLPHRVPLSNLAIALLRHIQRRTGWSVWLFPNPQGNDHMTEKAPTRALGRIRDQLGVEHFTIHDLRRTAASHLAQSGVSRLVVSKVLNHKEGGVTAIYDRYGYDKEMRKALDIWGRALMGYLRPESEADNLLEYRKPGAV